MADRELIERAQEEFIEAGSWPEADDLGEPIPVVDAVQANKVLRRIARLTRDLEQLEDIRDSTIRRATLFHEDASAGIIREIEWGKRSLHAFTMRYKARAKKGTLKLEGGSTSLTKPRDKVVVVDEAAFLDFVFGIKDDDPDLDPADPSLVPAHPELIRAKYSLIADAINAKTNTRLELIAAPDDSDLIIDHAPVSIDDPLKHELVALPDGTIVPGIEIQTPKEDKFDVKVGPE